MTDSPLQTECQKAIDAVAKDLANKLGGKITADEIKEDIGFFCRPEHADRIFGRLKADSPVMSSAFGSGSSRNILEPLIDHCLSDQAREIQSSTQLLMVLKLIENNQGFGLDKHCPDHCVEMLEFLKSQPLASEFTSKHHAEIEKALVGYIKKDILENGNLDSHISELLRTKSFTNQATQALEDALQAADQINIYAMKTFMATNKKAISNAIERLQTVDDINTVLVDMACVYLGDVLKELKPKSLTDYLASKTPSSEVSIQGNGNDRGSMKYSGGKAT